ncbi:hypothetical protein [Pararhizobium sp.]|uniref:hypothetical protein n=1 Tax=Pararhizobium sp. TaxID=1977563 RepID=UPI00272815D6|nr:hypothetical protein [Pararhizobium sp.]MDO9414769.1 hypothetical protein [Pararhizobium sp.]
MGLLLIAKRRLCDVAQGQACFKADQKEVIAGGNASDLLMGAMNSCDAGAFSPGEGRFSRLGA